MACCNKVGSQHVFMLMCQVWLGARYRSSTLMLMCNLAGTLCMPIKSSFFVLPRSKHNVMGSTLGRTSHERACCAVVCRLLPQAVSPRSKKFKGPGGLPLPSPVDPGHLLTKLNGDAASKRCKRHEFSLDTCLGPTIFHRTKARPPHKLVASA